MMMADDAQQVIDDRDHVDFEPGPLDRSSCVYVAGHRGLVGSAIWRRLEAEGFSNLVGRSRAEMGLEVRESVFEFFAETRPRYVVLAAAKVGGILANSTYPVDFLTDNLRVQTNVLDAALKNGVERLLFLGSSCIYPKFAVQPIKEESLLTGLLSRRTTLTPLPRSPASCRFRPFGANTACRGSRRCRQISTGPATTFRPPAHTSCQPSSVATTKPPSRVRPA